MITLYQRTDCPFCWKVRIALCDLGIEFEKVDLQLGEKHPYVVANSPARTVPVLVDDRLIIWESSVILDYLDARYANGHLVPVDDFDAVRTRLMHTYSDKIVGACLKDLVFEKRSKPESSWDLQLIREAEEKWEACQEWLEAQLGDETYSGDDLTAADCALAARFGVAEAYGAGVTDRFPRLHRWYTAVTARESWQRAYPTSFIRTPEDPRGEHASRQSCAVR